MVEAKQIPAEIIVAAFAAIPVASAILLLTQRVGGSPLQGYLSDVETGEPIVGASVTVDGNKTVSRSDGSYSLNLFPGTYTFTVEKINYQTYVGTVILPEEGITKDIPMTRIGEPQKIPVAIIFPEAPLSIIQYYRNWVHSKTIYQHLDVFPCTDEACGVKDFLYVPLMGRVIDATGSGVANIPMLVWHSAVPDREGGSLNLFGSNRTAGNPLRVYSDANGYFTLNVGYRVPMDWVGRHCDFIPAGGHPAICEWYTLLPFAWIACTSWETLPIAYSVYAKIEGTVIMGVGFIMANAKST